MRRLRHRSVGPPSPKGTLSRSREHTRNSASLKRVAFEVGAARSQAPAPGPPQLRSRARAAGGKKAHLADIASAERVSGSVTGAISPLGLRQELPVVIDEKVLLHSVVYVSAGRRGLEISLDPQDLIAATGAQVAALSASAGN